MSLCDVSPPIFLSFLLRPSIMGFICPDITDGVILWCWGGWKAPGDPLRSFRPPATYKDQLWLPWGPSDEPTAAWPGFVLETLATCRSITVGCLSVCLCSPVGCDYELSVSFRAKCLRDIGHCLGRQENRFIPGWAGFSLHDLGQIKPPLWFLISSSVKWAWGRGGGTRLLRHPKILF